MNIDQFASLISLSTVTPNTDITILSPKQFDPKGRYTSVIEKVKDTTTSTGTSKDKTDGENENENEVKVYRVGISHSNVEYWVIGLDVSNKRIVGVRAKAVET